MAVLICLVSAGGCDQRGLEKEERGLAAYRQLPDSSRTILETPQDLQGFTFYLIVNPETQQRLTINTTTWSITAMLLARGAYRADNAAKADLVITLKNSPQPQNSFGYNGISAEARDRSGNTLLSGAHRTTTSLSRALDTVVTGLGIERRNKALGK